MTRQGEPYDVGYLEIARQVFASTTKPFCVLSNLASAVANDEAALLRDDGIPVLEGTASGLAALTPARRTGDTRALPAVVPPAPVADDVRERWRARLDRGPSCPSSTGWPLLADYGVPIAHAVRHPRLTKRSRPRSGSDCRSR